MIARFFLIFYHLPWLLIFLSTILVAVGILALYSASEGAWTPWAERQMIRAAFGFILMFIVAIMPIRWIYRYAYLGLAIMLLLLLLLPFTGSGIGATRWLSIGGFNLQPSEPTKLALVIVLARYFSALTPEKIQDNLFYLFPICLIGLPFLLVLIQPDLGTSLMLLLGSVAVIFVAGLPRRLIYLSFVMVAIGLPILWSQLYEYQKQRVLVFLNPSSDPLGAGYQIAQSKIALGSGGLFGKEFLHGLQSRLDYLPEKQTDFVFTMIGEQLGFTGSLLILLIYFGLLFSILLISRRCQHRFGQLLCVGISFMIFLYVSVNVGMVTGLLPVVGAPLPLISYGGTVMLTVFVALGLVINMAFHSHLQDKDLY